MKRTAESFMRSGAKYEAQPTALVICEDSKSCKDYLEDAVRFYRSQARVTVTHGINTDPWGIVDHAVREKRRYTTIYCAIDRDRHANFQGALDRARTHGIKIIASYPCYEFWLLLHFRSTDKPYIEEGNKSPADCLVKDLCCEAEMIHYGKGKTQGLFEKLRTKLPDAVKRAEKSIQRANEVGDPNPSTLIHTLLADLEKLGSPVKI